MLAIKVDGLTKIFSGYKAVDSLSLNVDRGTIYGFLGPNGAGKTTTIRMLTGMSRPDSGTIEILGEKAVFGLPYKNSLIGVLPDVPDFYGWMTAREFLMLCGKLSGINKEVMSVQVGEIQKRVGLGGVNKKIKGYSRGMKQRLGIAQALLHNPKVLFLDEPTSALDPLGRKEILDLIASLKNDITVFLSTHIIADVERICDRVAVLDKGRILLEDNITSLKETFSDGAIQLKVFASQLIKAREILSKVKFVESITEKNEEMIEFKMPVNEKNCQELTAILGSNGIGIIEMTYNRVDLEEIFVKVVNHK